MADNSKKLELLPAESPDSTFINELEEVFNDSNPSLSAENDHFWLKKWHFLDVFKKVWQSMAEKHPYKLCRLVHHNYDLSKRWYVIFYAWNVATERVERKRIFDPINREKTIPKRLAVAREIIVVTNADLRAGKVLGKQQLKKISKSAKSHVEKLTLTQAIKYFVEEKRKAKRRMNYLKRFDGNLLTHLNKFYDEKRVDDPLIKHVVNDTEFVEMFFDYLRPICRSNKTFNNYRSDITVVLNFLNKKKSKKLFTVNPVEVVEKLRVVKKKHAAFSDEQIAKIISTAEQKGLGELVLYLRFMYYTLGRPAELLTIEVNDIDMVNNRIIFHGDDAKNWRDEYVNISPGFREIIKQSGIIDQPGDSRVFGLSYKTLYKQFREVLDDLKLREKNPNYSLYSIKHSGAISLYLSTLDIYAVKEQCRHTTIKQTDDYLRDLGVVRKESPVMKWTGAA